MNTTYLAERTRNIAGYKVNTVFEVYEDTKGAICIEFETIGEDNMPLDNTTQGAGFSIKDIRSIFRGIKIMMRKANDKVTLLSASTLLMQNVTAYILASSNRSTVKSLQMKMVNTLPSKLSSNIKPEYAFKNYSSVCQYLLALMMVTLNRNRT